MNTQKDFQFGAGLVVQKRLNEREHVLYKQENGKVSDSNSKAPGDCQAPL